jgi:hypothetical protein
MAAPVGAGVDRGAGVVGGVVVEAVAAGAATVAAVEVEVAAAEIVETAVGGEDVGVVIGTRIANTARRTTTKPAFSV